MPKEIAHWYIAGLTADSLRGPGAQDEAISASIASYPEDYLIGAVAYDSPFYTMGMRDRKRFASIANTLHGVAGEDTFLPFQRVLETIDAGRPSTALAFLAGALTHYAADVTIHPYVGYYCIGTENVERSHRAFETMADLFIQSNRRLPPPLETERPRLGRLLDRVDLAALANTLSRFYAADDAPDPKRVLSVLKRHAAIRDRFDRAGWRSLITGATAVVGQKLETIVATWYPSPETSRKWMPAITGFFGSRVSYRHPRTGDEATQSFDDLCHAATALAATLFEALSNRSLSDMRGLSLDSGCDLSLWPDNRFTGFSESLAAVNRHYR